MGYDATEISKEKQKKLKTSKQEIYIFLITYIFLILFVEMGTAYNSPKVGVLFYIFVLFLILLHSVITDKNDFSNFFLTLSLLPLIRILGLSVPLAPFSYILWFPIISIPLFIATFVCIYIQDLRLRDIGLTIPKPNKIPIEVGIVLSSIPFGFIEYYIMRDIILETPLISELNLTSMILAMVLFISCSGFLEELIFRGLMQNNAKKLLGSSGILLVTILYAIMHIANLSVLGVILAFVLGGFYSVVVEKTNSLLGVSLSHGILNFVVFIAAPFYL